MQEHYQSFSIVDKVAVLWLNAKTRTAGKKDQIQGAGWQLIIRDQAEEANDWDLFQCTQKLWLAQNGQLQPRFKSYSLTHKL